MINVLSALVSKDLKVFLSDRRAMLISIAVPVVIACFMAVVFGSAGQQKPASKIKVAVVDLDQSKTTIAIVAELSKSAMLEPVPMSDSKAVEAVRKGDLGAAVIFPKGFGHGAMAALRGGSKPTMRLLFDPSQNVQMQAVRGSLAQPIMQTVAQQALGPAAPSMDLPFQTKEEPQTAANGADKWSGIAHAFAGMALQGLLFWSIESAMGMMRERRQGIWKRQRAAPVPPVLLLLGRLLSITIRALIILVAVFGVGAIVFHLRIEGSAIGFVLIALCAALMAAGFGLFIAALGRTEQQSRGLSILAVLMMLMLGGAWFPSFLMPTWVQTLAMAFPVRWAVEGFDSMTWRGGDLAAALPNIGVLLAFAVVFSLIALKRFRWDAEAA